MAGMSGASRAGSVQGGEGVGLDVGRAFRPSGPIPALRLTRRGRAVIVGVLLLAVLAFTAVAAVATSAATRPAPVRTERVVVQPGDTLWGIAVSRQSGRDPRLVVDQIRRLSHLSDNAVHPGQELVLPLG